MTQRGCGPTGEMFVASMHWILCRRMTWGVEADGRTRPPATPRCSHACLFEPCVDDGRKHRRRIQARNYAHNQTIESSSEVAWAQSTGSVAGRPCCTWRALSSPFRRPENLAWQRGPEIWSGRMLSWQQSFKRSRAARLEKKNNALTVGNSHLAGRGWGARRVDDSLARVYPRAG